MQIAHGGHEAALAVEGQGAAELGDGVEDLHAQNP